ncbi:hypothetical protein SRABI118_03591 [Massilia sp. Bi118]|uniref:hypothetical protein n=1 Tax=Massilia sp. Bi118 TaxID=2822346 RepID=UPI001DE989CF|nr:hypothetical protein [Massilia sp. Bi118]CAH0274719.1 hypothetical protein SRABI118_03591 [Massilia sp. Bi118]
MKKLIALTLLLLSNAAIGGTPAPRDGQHDFDWEIGAWDTQLKRLREPLSGKSDWVEYAGTTVVKPVMGGRANLVELDVRGSAGRIPGVSLRLYQPASGQWTLHFANLANGLMTERMHGVFQDGEGSFYGQDTLNGRTILVRFLILPMDARRWRFEQAYSADGGQHWETNWIAIDTRRGGAPTDASPVAFCSDPFGHGFCIVGLQPFIMETE